MKRLFTLVISLCVVTFSHAQALVQLPEANLEDTKGNTISTSSISNFDSPTVVITYAVSWCNPCVELLNSLNDSYDAQASKSGVKIVAVNVEKDQSNSSVWLEANRKGWSSFQILNDVNREFMTAMHTQSAPKVFFLDANQNVVFCFEGYKITADQIYGLAKLIKDKQVTADKVYFNDSWFPCAKANARYYRTITKKSSGTYTVTDYFMSGKEQMVAGYKTVYPHYRDGSYATYYESGAKQTQGNYEDEVKTGIWMDWYEDGKVQFKKNFVNGSEDGLWTMYHPNGKKANEGVFVEGHPNGMWYHYYDNGMKRRETKWDNGAKKYCTGWYASGKLKYKIRAFDKDNDFSLPDASLYYENGQSELGFTFDKDSNVTDIKQFYESGELKSIIKINSASSDANISFTEYYKNGNRKMTSTLDDDAKLNGKLLKWAENGQKILEMEFEVSKAKGLGMAWYPSGAIKEKIDFTTKSQTFYKEDGSTEQSASTSILLHNNTTDGIDELLNQTVLYFNEILDADLKLSL